LVNADEPQVTQRPSQRAWIDTMVPYIVPTALFMLMTALEGYRPAQYVWIYIAKVFVVSASLVVYRQTWKDYKFDWRVVLPAIVVGLIVFAEWIPIDKVTPFHLSAGKRTALNPFASITDPSVRALFLAFRFFGLALMVPFMEELFWRSFLLRLFSEPDGDFRTLPQGKFTWAAFGIVVAAFALAHPEWLSAVICAVLYGLLLWKTRNLFACFLAHAVTNLVLGIYIIQTHNWIYW
jgi:uncharacterized protein